jgi:hypothetical protein
LNLALPVAPELAALDSDVVETMPKPTRTLPPAFELGVEDAGWLLVEPLTEPLTEPLGALLLSVEGAAHDACRRQHVTTAAKIDKRFITYPPISFLAFLLPEVFFDKKSLAWESYNWRADEGVL